MAQELSRAEKVGYLAMSLVEAVVANLALVAFVIGLQGSTDRLRRLFDGVVALGWPAIPIGIAAAAVGVVSLAALLNAGANLYSWPAKRRGRTDSKTAKRELVTATVALLLPIVIPAAASGLGLMGQNDAVLVGTTSFLVSHHGVMLLIVLLGQARKRDKGRAIVTVLGTIPFLGALVVVVGLPLWMVTVALETPGEFLVWLAAAATPAFLLTSVWMPHRKELNKLFWTHKTRRHLYRYKN